MLVFDLLYSCCIFCDLRNLCIFAVEVWSLDSAVPAPLLPSEQLKSFPFKSVLVQHLLRSKAAKLGK